MVAYQLTDVVLAVVVSQCMVLPQNTIESNRIGTYRRRVRMLWRQKKREKGVLLRPLAGMFTSF